MEYQYFDRDLSWLSFNERVLEEAGRKDVPLLERINFLSIYSSNLDEFYRVRIPALMALRKLKRSGEDAMKTITAINLRVQAQQELFGRQLTELVPALREAGPHLVYKEPLPTVIIDSCREYFFNRLLAFLEPVILKEDTVFFPANNRLYMVVTLSKEQKTSIAILNIPSDQVPRFFSLFISDQQYIVFIDDIIKANIGLLFPGMDVHEIYNFKITRDAELDLQDEYEGDLAEKIEKQIARRDQGYATRLLYSPGLPVQLLEAMIRAFQLTGATIVQGGAYHNLKDLASLPFKSPHFSYPKWPSKTQSLPAPLSLLDSIRIKDILVNTPYQDYSLVLRFFNEAATHPDVDEIFVTMYRIAGDSQIAHSLITAAENGKSVTVFVELKARFDEANNIRWSKKMKAAGVKIINSIPGLKVHAKIALVKKKKANRDIYYGLLATGNFNESTARFYTDHIIMTADKEVLRELELLFIFLAKRKKPDSNHDIEFHQLLVAQFNLQQQFLSMIDREITAARQGLPARIVIKLNNLEEKILIDKLYEASNAGVKVDLLIRSICRLIPSLPGQSENISVHRIVDRYLEHGRIFWFHNKGKHELYAGSADWMNRNIYRRIEVCFPIRDPDIKLFLQEILSLQLADTMQAVTLDTELYNHPIPTSGIPVRSQEAIWQKI